MSALHVRIGTRASQLAQWQANWVAEALRRLGATVELVPISTRGDRRTVEPLVHLDQPGLFTKEIQSAVLTGEADLAVHSLKDLPTSQVTGLVLAAVPEREDPADALVSAVARDLAGLVAGARIGTGSPRRAAQLRHLRPDLQVADIRGNVDTRLRKLDAGAYDALVLAAAGLRRLGWQERISELLGPPVMLPAPGQGALALECRADDAATRALAGQLDHRATRQAVEAERTLLAELQAGCSAPVGSWGRMESGQLVLDGLVANLAGTRVLRATAHGEASAFAAVGRAVAADLLDQGAGELVAAAKSG